MICLLATSFEYHLMKSIWPMPMENWLEAFGFYFLLQYLFKWIDSVNERPNEGKRIAFKIDFDGCKSIFVSDWETNHWRLSIAWQHLNKTCEHLRHYIVLISPILYTCWWYFAPCTEVSVICVFFQFSLVSRVWCSMKDRDLNDWPIGMFWK